MLAYDKLDDTWYRAQSFFHHAHDTIVVGEQQPEGAPF